MRRTLLSILVVLGLFAGHSSAIAHQVRPENLVGDLVCANGADGLEAVCKGGRNVTVDIGKVVSPVAEAAASTVSDIRYTAFDRVAFDGPNGEPCAAVGWKAEEPATGPPSLGHRVGEQTIDGFVAGLPECPVPANEASPSTGAEAATTYVVQYWQNIPLPKPEPYIAPGRAITGLDAYLETRGTTTHSYNEADTPFGALTIVATGKYYVDWGDGTTTGPHSREGKPWPDGEIKHQYINIGAYDVVVTERWTATWTFGSESGRLDELRTVGRIEDFPVGQIQAVVYQ